MMVRFTAGLALAALASALPVYLGYRLAAGATAVASSAPAGSAPAGLALAAAGLWLLAVVAVAGGLLRRMALEPISRLTASARRLAAGTLELLPPGGCEEIGALTGALNELIGIRQRSAGDLEEDVARRTEEYAVVFEELLAANEELQARRGETEATLEAWQRSEEQLRLLLDSTAEAIYGTDREGKCTFCNSTCLRLLGYSHAEQLVGKDLHWQLHRLLPNEDGGLFDACRKGERVHREGELLWRADGSTFPVELWSYPQYRDGRAVGAVTTFLDVSERLRTQERLLKLSRAVENSPATVVITDRYGSIEYVNPKFSEIAGYLPEEAIGQNPRILNAGVQSKEFYRELWTTITAGREWRGEFCNRKKNGEIHWEHASISPIRDEKGNITHFVAVKEDVTERKRVAQELQQAKDAADAANSYKSQFLANMSHEIRTPLNAIIGFSALALEGAPRDDYLRKINNAGKSLLGIVNDILDFSKVEAGKLGMERTGFRVDQTVADALAVVRQQAREKGLELVLELAPEACGSFVGDPLRLGQVLTNLVGNAVKFTEKGEVRLQVLLQEVEPERSCLRFSVSDTGIGLSADSLAGLFRPFAQADGSTTRKFGGTGLGLCISKQLVELMGGSIRAESEPGRGSTFSFTAWFGAAGTAADGGEGAPERDREAPPDLSGLRVLLAEDNEVNRQLAVILLSGAGAVVAVAENGRQAVEMVLREAHGFDLVLMDVQMPEMDGYQATARIREDPRLARLPIVAMTAHALPAERQRMLSCGMDDCIVKPIDARSMFRIIARQLTRPLPGPGPDAGALDAAGAEPMRRIPGVDVSGALSRLDGNKKLYQWLLRAFLESEQATASSIALALERGERELAERLAHTSKGSAGSIGAYLVMEAGAELERAIAREAGEAATREALGVFEAALRRLLLDLGRELPASAAGRAAPAPEHPFDPAAAEAVLTRLLRHIRESDGSALECLEEHGDRLSGLPGEELARLKGHLSAFDYDGALEALAALSAKAGLPLPELS